MKEQTEIYIFTQDRQFMNEYKANFSGVVSPTIVAVEKH
jgi:hypothetical protein